MRRAIVIALLALTTTADAKRDRTVTGDVIKAARFLTSSRIDEARTLLADLEKRAPDAVEVKWLEAELAFQTGDYAGSVKLLDKIPDDAVDGMVGQTRKLAQQTLDVTDNFTEKKSPKGHFLIRYQSGSADGAIAELAGEVLDTAWETIGDDLGEKPADPIRVEILGAPSDLAKLSPLTESEIEKTGTIALSKYNKLMVVSPRATLFGYPWMDTLAHEYTHLVVSQVSQNTVPIWLHEGLAKYLESRWRGAPGQALTPSMLALLGSRVRSNTLIPFEKMHPSIALLPTAEDAATAFGLVTISLLNLQIAIVPVVWISLRLSVETRASSGASLTISTRTFSGGEWPRSWASAAWMRSRVSSA